MEFNSKHAQSFHHTARLDNSIGIPVSLAEADLAHKQRVALPIGHYVRNYFSRRILLQNNQMPLPPPAKALWQVVQAVLVWASCAFPLASRFHKDAVHDPQRWTATRTCRWPSSSPARRLAFAVRLPWV
jgi:hypothetical protein